MPTDSDNLTSQTPEALARLLSSYWEVVSLNTGLPPLQIADQALIAPARCCLKNVGRVSARDDTSPRETGRSPDLTVEEQLIEEVFSCLGTLSGLLKDKFGL